MTLYAPWTLFVLLFGKCQQEEHEKEAWYYVSPRKLRLVAKLFEGAARTCLLKGHIWSKILGNVYNADRSSLVIR